MQYIIPSILFSISLGIFFALTNPLIKDIEIVRDQAAQLDSALNDTKKIQSIRDSLLNKFNAIDVSDRENLLKILPVDINNAWLILEIDTIAFRNGILIKDINIFSGKSNNNFDTPQDPYQNIEITLGLTGTYETLRSFIKELEKSLRIIDVSTLSFTSGEGRVSKFTIKLKTYWLE